MVETSDKMWSTREGNGKPLQYSCLENTMNNMNRQNDRILKEELPRPVGAQYATGDQWRSSIQSTKTRPGADCGSDDELLMAKIRLKLKKVGKTTRPFRYDLNQIPYDYTVEVTNRFKGLDMISK